MFGILFRACCWALVFLIVPSASVHSRFVATATRLINKHGRNASLVSVSSTGSAYNPEQTETATSVVIVQTKFTLSEIDGELVKSGDLRFLMDSSVAPANDMHIDDNGTRYQVINVQEIKPGQASVLYKVQVRA